MFIWFCTVHKFQRWMSATPLRRRKVGKTGISPSPLRLVTPLRTNAKSLPELVQAHLCLDVHNTQGRNPDLHSLQWRPNEYQGLNRDKVRKRFYYYRDLKCLGDQNEWRARVQEAKRILRELQEQSEYKYRKPRMSESRPSTTNSPCRLRLSLTMVQQLFLSLALFPPGVGTFPFLYVGWYFPRRVGFFTDSQGRRRSRRPLVR